MPHQIHGNTKQRRLREAMLLQQQIAREWAESQVGKKAKVLADTAYLGRTQGDAPDVDCRVHFVKPVAPGRFVNCVITGTRDYDLVGDEIR
jgi:tRNA A37 methylthiotransferase MiaB